MFNELNEVVCAVSTSPSTRFNDFNDLNEPHLAF